MASRSLRVKIFVTENDYWLFDGSSASYHPQNQNDEEEPIEHQGFTSDSQLADVKQALEDVTLQDAGQWIVSYHGDEIDEEIPEGETLGRVFENADEIELDAVTPALGERDIYSWRPGGERRVILKTDGKNCFNEFIIVPNDKHPVKLNATFWSRKDKLYVVDLIDKEEKDPEKRNFQIRRYILPKLERRSDVVIDDAGNVLLGTVQRVEDQNDVTKKHITGVEGLAGASEPVKIEKEDGLVKQYKQAWNDGTGTFDKRIALTKTVVEMICSVLGVALSVVGL